MGERRKNQRLKLDRTVRVPVQVCPVMPFLGRNIEAILLNISAGGMSISVGESSRFPQLKKKTALKIHFHFPGGSLFECRGNIAHRFNSRSDGMVLGIRFLNPSLALVGEIDKIIEDNEICDNRVGSEHGPWCDVLCSYHYLCRKPFRAFGPQTSQNQIEFSFQIEEEFLGARPHI